MKKLLMTTALVSMISFGAQAVTKDQIAEAKSIGNSAVCNTLDHGVEFNKTELSAFDKCWLAVHKSDEMSGVLGGLYWAKAGDSYISIPMKTLINAGSKDKAMEIIKDRVITEIVEVEVIKEIEVVRERIVEVERELTAAQQEAITYLGGFLSDPNSNKDQIRSFLNTGQFTFRDAQGNITDAAASWDRANTIGGHMSVLTSVVSALTQDIDALGQAKLDAAEYARDISNITATDAYSEVRNGFSINIPARTRIENITRYVSGLGIPGNTLSTYRNAIPGDEVPAVDRSRITAHTNKTNSTAGGYGGSGFDNTRYASTILNGTPLQSNGFGNLNAAIKDLVEQVHDISYTQGYEAGYDQGYQDGFSDGYNEGYADGYSDGFSDGVASVR